MTRPLLVPGETCATLVEHGRGGLLVDGKDFYRAFYDAACKARRYIMMAGWQFSSTVQLVRGSDAACCEHPTQLIDLLRTLCDERPELEVYLLPWDSSPVFTFEREPLQRLKFRAHGHKRIHWKMDNCHPAGASQHQKLIVVDRSIAFVGGMDLCDGRWDDRHHDKANAERCGANKRPYTPYHDVQAYVTGDAVDILSGWFCDRWRAAAGAPLDLDEVPREHIEITPTFEVAAPRIGLARTFPPMDEPKRRAIDELFHLHLRALGSAKRLVYIENQYFSCDELAKALESRMRQGGDPLEIVMVFPDKSAGFKERLSIGMYQARLLERLGRVADAYGHHLGVYYQVARGCEEGEEVPVFIHAKVLAVDDRFLLVSSANTSNRSMGFDSELGIAWEAPEPTESLRDARIELLAEHCGLAAGDAQDLLANPTGLVARLDAIARAKSHSLRIHRRNVDEKPGPLLRKLLPAETPFDPDNPLEFRESLLPERGTFLDRLLREPMMLLRGAKPRKKAH